MNIKKTSVITLIALLSCDTFAASSIVRAGVTPLGQATGVRATPSAGNSTNRASLGIGSYYDINKLRPNRTQTSAGGSTGGSTGGSSNNVSNSALESVRQELTEVKTTLTKQISDLVKLVEAKNAEIQNLQNDLADATEEIEQIAGKKYVIESDLVDRFNQIKEDAVRGAINAVNDSSYAKGSYVDQEIDALRSEITAERDKALESYAKKEVVRTDIATAKQAAIDAAAANVTAQGYISAATVQADINTAKNAAIADAVDQAKLAVQSTLETYATKDDVSTAESNAIKAIENKNYATKDYVDTAENDAVKTIEGKGYLTQTELNALEKNITAARETALQDYATNTALTTLEKNITDARNAALEKYATMGYVDDATNDLTDNGYVTNADLTTLESKITKARDEVLGSYVTIAQAQEDAKTVKQDAADLAIQQATEGKLFATPEYVDDAKLAAIADAVADVKELDYATNKQVTDLSNDVTASIAGLQTAIDTTDGKLSALDTQLGNATENALTTESVDGLIAKALSDGKYITQSTLNDRAGEITSSILALDDKFATKTYVDGTFAQKSVITQIQSDISGLNTRITTNSTDLANNQNTLATLETDLKTAKENITNLQTGASGAITMDNVNTAIDTALANKKYATSAELGQRELDIKAWVKKDYATYTYVDDEIKSANDDIIKIKLPDYATVATVNSLQERLNTTDSSLAALTTRTETLEGDAGDYVTNGKLADELAPYATNDTLAKYVTRDEIKTAFDDTKPLVTLNQEGKLTFVKDNFNAAVLPNLAGYVQDSTLNQRLDDYAKTASLADYVTRDEIKTAFMVPDGTGAEPKPLIQYEGEGKWTFVKDNFESAVNGVTNVANMQGLYNWFIGKDTTNDSGWFAKDKNNVFTLKDGFAKSIKDLKEVGTDNSLFVQTSTLSEYAKTADVEGQVNKLLSEKEMPEKWQKSIFDVLAFDNTKPLVREDGDGKWTFQVNEFNAAVQTNLAGYVQDSTLNDRLDDYAKTADIKNEYATQVKLKELEDELDTDYIKTDDLAQKIVDSYKNGYLKELPYATKSELTTEITRISPNMTEVSDLISRVKDLEAYKTGDISIVAGELIKNPGFMEQILNGLDSDNINTSAFVTQTSLETKLGDYVTNTDLSTKLGDYAKTSDLSDYAKKSDIPAGEGNDMSEYAKTSDLAQYATKEEMNKGLKNLSDALVIPDGSEENNNTKPLIKYNEKDGELTFEKTNFDQAVIGVTEVENMQGLYNWLVGTGDNAGGWFKKEDDVFALNTGAEEGFAKSVGGVELSKNTTIKDLAGTVDKLNTTVSSQATEIASLKDSVTANGLKTILTTEKEGTVPLLKMLTEAAGNSADTNALLLRALTTNDETSEQPLLSNALVFEVGETDGDKVPLVLSLKTEKDEPILASQDDYTTLNSNYSTLNTTVGSLYGSEKLFSLNDTDNTLSLNTTVFSDSMAAAITTAKRGDGEEGVCSADFKANELTEALSLESCGTTDSGKTQQ